MTEQSEPSEGRARPAESARPSATPPAKPAAQPPVTPDDFIEAWDDPALSGWTSKEARDGEPGVAESVG